MNTFVTEKPLHFICDVRILPDRRHVGGDRTSHRAELRGVMRQMRDPSAPNLILAGQAGNIGAGAPDPPALDDGSFSSRLRQMPGQQLTAKPTAQDEDVNPFRFRHKLPPLCYWFQGKSERLTVKRAW